MLKKISEQRFFEQFISLVGSEITLATRSEGKKIEGIVSNAMFDSFILNTKDGDKVIWYNDLVFFERK